VEYTYNKQATVGNWTVGIDSKARYGYAEYNGEEFAGLWFNSRRSIEDFDGCFFIPVSLAKVIRQLGYHVPADCLM
jgi:hypothetical protein